MSFISSLTLAIEGKNFACWAIFHDLFCCLLIFLKINFLTKILSGMLSECQTVWTRIRINILSVLIWVQTVCKDHQQMARFAASRQRVKTSLFLGIYEHHEYVKNVYLPIIS